MCHQSLTDALQRTMAEAQTHMRDIMEHTVQHTMAQLPTMLAATIASAVPPPPQVVTGGQRLPQETLALRSLSPLQVTPPSLSAPTCPPSRWLSYRSESASRG
eukprot:1818127-Prorocentrum_lima.AAC.1